MGGVTNTSITIIVQRYIIYDVTYSSITLVSFSNNNLHNYTCLLDQNKVRQHLLKSEGGGDDTTPIEEELAYWMPSENLEYDTDL